MTEPTMDCEKFESAMMDELYGDLDEVTSAAVKRHVAGCPGCAALLDGFRATRHLAALPLVEPPHSLEGRILDAAWPTPPAVSLGRRLARIVSIAGTWAMRPQTAMAALFLVMVGVSVPLLRGKSSREAATATVTVTEQGTPAPAAPPPAAPIAPVTDMPPALELASARPADMNSAPAKPSRPAPDTALVAQRESTRDRFAGPTVWRGENALARKSAASEPAATFAAPPPGPASAAVASRSAHMAPASAGVAAAAPVPAMGGGAAGAPESAPAAVAAAAPVAAAPAPAAYARAADESETAAPATPFESALAAYQARRYDDASRAFETLAGTDPNADLWAARSLREGRGCAAAAGRFDQVARRGAGTPAGWEALLESAQCYRALGDIAGARSRLTALLKVDSYKDRAQAELDRLAHAGAR